MDMNIKIKNINVHLQTEAKQLIYICVFHIKLCNI